MQPSGQSLPASHMSLVASSHVPPACIGLLSVAPLRAIQLVCDRCWASVCWSSAAPCTMSCCGDACLVCRAEPLPNMQKQLYRSLLHASICICIPCLLRQHAHHPCSYCTVLTIAQLQTPMLHSPPSNCSIESLQPICVVPREHTPA